MTMLQFNHAVIQKIILKIIRTYSNSHSKHFVSEKLC